MAQEGRKPCPLYGTIKQQHEAIDLLFAMLIKADPTFYPSKSGTPWEAARAGSEIIRQLESHRCIEDEIRGGDEPGMGAQPREIEVSALKPIQITPEQIQAAMTAFPNDPMPVALMKYMGQKMQESLMQMVNPAPKAEPVKERKPGKIKWDHVKVWERGQRMLALGVEPRDWSFPLSLTFDELKFWCHFLCFYVSIWKNKKPDLADRMLKTLKED